MLERETELIKQIIVESTIKSRTAVRMNEVVAADLPRGVKAYMVAETMKLLATDFEQSTSLSRITKSVAHTVTTERTLLRSLAMEYVFQRDEFLKLVEDTVHFLENYLCRPQWTLHQLMFEQNQKIQFAHLVSQFEYVVDYSYFGSLVERYARRRGWKEIEADAFKELLAHIDREVTKQHSPRELALLTKPIFDFLLFGDASMNRPIPLGAILLFFEDKKLNAVKEYVDRICQIRARTQISMNELLSIIDDLYQVETTVKEEVEESEHAFFAPLENEDKRVTAGQPQAPPLEVQPAPEDIGAAPTAVHKETSEAGSEQATHQPENGNPPQDFHLHNNSAEPTLDPGVEPFTIPPTEQHASVVSNPQQLLAYALKRDTLRQAPIVTLPERKVDSTQDSDLPDVDSLITEEQRAIFTRKIFKNDETNYRIFISSLNKAQTWREAQVYLRELFQLNKLDLLSPDVAEFTDAMHSRYEPELKRTE